jgi:hypothetical protein
MPQPLSSLPFLQGAIHIGGNNDSPSYHRPQIALWAMSVVAEWAILEGFKHALFVKMLGDNPRPAAAIFGAVTSTVAQRDAMRAVAELTLPQGQQELFAVLLKLFDTAHRQRNKVAHWIWGYHEGIKDGALLADPTAFMEWNIAAKEWTPGRYKAGLLQGQEIPFPEAPRDRIYVYREADLKEISDKIQRLIRYFVLMRFCLYRSDTLQNPNGLVMSQLLNEPEVREVLARLHERQRRSQAGR